MFHPLRNADQDDDFSLRLYSKTLAIISVLFLEASDLNLLWLPFSGRFYNGSFWKNIYILIYILVKKDVYHLPRLESPAMR